MAYKRQYESYYITRTFNSWISKKDMFIQNNKFYNNIIDVLTYSMRKDLTK